MSLFSINCTTCNARLKVRDASAIGQIVACPKCHSMVLVEPPADFELPVATTVAPPAPDETTNHATEEPAQAAAAEALADAETPDFPDPKLSLSPLEQRWRRLRTRVGIPAIALMILISAWLLLRSNDEQPAPLAQAQPPAIPATSTPQSSPAERQNDPVVARFDRRWLPADAQWVLSIRPAQIARQGDLLAALGRNPSPWQRALFPLQQTFRLAPEEIARVTWAGVSPDANAERSLVVVELVQPLQDPAAILAGCQPLDVKLDQAVCHRATTGEWKWPFALVDARTIVSGPMELLKPLAQAAVQLASPTLDALLKVLDLQQPLALAIDLAQFRESHWPLPLGQFHRELAHEPAWGELRKLTSGIAGGVDPTVISLELHLLAANPSSAETLEAAAVQLRESVDRRLETQTAELDRRLRAGELNAALVEQAEILLQHGRSSLQHAQIASNESFVTVHSSWKGIAAGLWSAALVSLPVWQDSAMQFAKQADESHHQEILAGLAGYEKAEGSLPQGAAGLALIAPEQRLSWQATLLPYFGHRDWHRELNFSRSWNDPANLLVVKRPVELLINPALGPQTTAEGFPVTHYVGLGGWGPDAASLEPTDPRAGVFGHNRRLNRASLGDGASMTIATLGVSGNLGPWAAGGQASVRSFTRQPYINGPDGFGSGQADGMLAGMADGSVRFLSKHISPRVLQQLATVHGAKPTTFPATDTAAPAVAAAPAAAPKLEPKPVEPAPPPPLTVMAGPSPETEQKLSAMVPSMEFPRITLAEFAQFVSQMSALPITLDADTLAEAGVTGNSPLSLRMVQCTIGELLRRALAEHGLACLASQDQLLITSSVKARGIHLEVRHPIGDLTGEDPVVAALFARLATQVVEPGSWSTAGGRGTMEVQPNQLLVRNAPEVHAHLLELCERLRAVRKLPQRSPHARHRFPVATRSRRLSEKLAEPLTANFADELPLALAVDQLRERTGLNLLIDGPALRAEGVSLQTEVRLSATEQPLEEVLKRLLSPLKLVYRVLDGNSLEITTASAASKRSELEIVPIDKLLNAERTAASIIEQIESQIEPAAWGAAGGSGAIRFEPTSQALLIWQTPAVQSQIEDLLDSWRRP